jgi:hypothetical protein
VSAVTIPLMRFSLNWNAAAGEHYRLARCSPAEI